MNIHSSNVQLPSVFTEMLRSFVALARSLNLSRAVDELGVSRQTIHRHIKEIEALKGATLFELVDRQYRLTAEGQRLLAPAERILAQASNWLLEEGGAISSELNHAGLQIDDQRYVYVQQHHLNKIWTYAPPLLIRGLQDWISAKGELEHKALSVIRPYILVSRQYQDDWLCVEVGEKSSYATWLGWPLAKSSLGRAFFKQDRYSEADAHLLNAYRSVSETGNVWYDHICAKLDRKPEEPPEPVNYQRLVAACKFPDGEPAILVLVARTDNVVVPGFPGDKIERSNKDDLMEFEI